MKRCFRTERGSERGYIQKEMYPNYFCSASITLTPKLIKTAPTRLPHVLGTEPPRVYLRTTSDPHPAMETRINSRGLISVHRNAATKVLDGNLGESFSVILECRSLGAEHDPKDTKNKRDN